MKSLRKIFTSVKRNPSTPMNTIYTLQFLAEKIFETFRMKLTTSDLNMMPHGCSDNDFIPQRPLCFKWLWSMILFPVQDIHPSDGFGITYLSEIYLRGFQILMPQDYFRYYFQRDTISAGIRGWISPEVMGRYMDIQLGSQPLNEGSRCRITDRKYTLFSLKGIFLHVFCQLSWYVLRHVGYFCLFTWFGISKDHRPIGYIWYPDLRHGALKDLLSNEALQRFLMLREQRSMTKL